MNKISTSTLVICPWSATQPHTRNCIVQARPKRCHLHHPWHSDLQPHLVSCWHLSAIVEGISRISAKYYLHRPYTVCGARYVWLEYCWLLMMPVWWQLLANSLASSTPSALLDLSYIRTQTYIDFLPANLLVLAVIFIVLFYMSLVLAR